jgi:hypothetical protein
VAVRVMDLDWHGTKGRGEVKQGLLPISVIMERRRAVPAVPDSRN